MTRRLLFKQINQFIVSPQSYHEITSEPGYQRNNNPVYFNELAIFDDKYGL
jgi:hypothetical protein